eukprot:scpid73883/ scgid8927/ 
MHNTASACVWALLFNHRLDGCLLVCPSSSILSCSGRNPPSGVTTVLYMVIGGMIIVTGCFPRICVVAIFRQTHCNHDKYTLTILSHHFYYGSYSNGFKKN